MHLTRLKLSYNLCLDVADSLSRFNDEDRTIHTAKGFVGGLYHEIAKASSRLVHTGGVEEYELILTLGKNSRYTVSCGLGLFRYDCDLLADHRVK